jgi:prophage antirepressor-like protein
MAFRSVGISGHDDRSDRGPSRSLSANGLHGSKVGILSALVATAGADPEIRALADDARRESDPAHRLRKAARVIRVLMEHEGELLDLLWQAGSGHPELVEAWRQMHRNRHETLTSALEPIVLKLKPAARRRGVDIAWAISSPEMYRLLVTERGWSPDTFERWLADSLVSQLLAAQNDAR